MSKLIHVLLFKVNIPIVFLPTAIICMANYYIFDLGEKSFYLPCPMWWVITGNIYFGNFTGWCKIFTKLRHRPNLLKLHTFLWANSMTKKPKKKLVHIEDVTEWHLRINRKEKFKKKNSFSFDLVTTSAHFQLFYGFLISIARKLHLIHTFLIDFKQKSYSIYIRMPFSWKTPLGFILTIICETFSDAVALAIGVPIITFFVGSCWLFHCILKNSPTLNRNHARLAASTSHSADDIELKRALCKMVQFYSDVKELSQPSCSNWRKHI